MASTNPIPDEGRFPPIPSQNDERRSRGFEPLSAIIADLKARIEAVYHDDPEAAADMHDELVSVECEQRILMTVRRFGK